jgi:dihydroorotase
MKLLIANGHLIDPACGQNSGKSILIEKGRVIDWLNHNDCAPADCEIFDATGLIVAPGFIDLHVHLREPGQEYKETIASGCAAAVAGGFTSVCPMPNTKPINDNAAITRFIIEQARRAGFANVFPVGAITKESCGSELAEIGEMKAAGAVAVSDDGQPVPNAGMMRRALEYARDFDLPVVDHCEDKSLSSGGVMHEGKISLLLGLKGMPALAEDLDVVRDVLLAQAIDAQIHIAHISTKGAVEIVRRAKENGVKVSAEVTPHHFCLTDRQVEGYDTNSKMSPPLRSKEHLEAVIEAIKDGTIDAIATDHAPHHADEKALEFDAAPFGITGLETAVGLAFEKLVHTGFVSLQRLIEMFSTNPARIFKLRERGTLQKGAIADITILDADLQWTFHAAESKSKSKNTPFDGWTFRGAAVATIVGGQFVYAKPQVNSRFQKSRAA